jgi:hypothetical protein
MVIRLQDEDRSASSGSGQGARVPAESVLAVARSAACLALIDRDGMLAVLSRRLTRDLGLDTPEDLSGLPVGSLWHPNERARVARAFAEALRGHCGLAEVDMGYVASEGGRARLTFTPGPACGAVLMTLDRPAPPA